MWIYCQQEDALLTTSSQKPWKGLSATSIWAIEQQQIDEAHYAQLVL